MFCIKKIFGINSAVFQHSMVGSIKWTNVLKIISDILKKTNYISAVISKKVNSNNLWLYFTGLFLFAILKWVNESLDLECKKKKMEIWTTKMKY